MKRDFFPQTTIAVIWDFDKTLIPEYMQAPLFEKYSINGKDFWKEVNSLPDYYKRRGLDLLSPDTLYLNHILTYVRGATGFRVGTGLALRRKSRWLS